MAANVRRLKMITYWSDFIRLLLPGLLLKSISALPLAFGTVIAAIHLRKANAGPYMRNLWGSTAAGFAALMLLFGSLFGGDLSSSSTAGLIFLFAPIYSAIALGVGYGLGALSYRVIARNTISKGLRPTMSRLASRFILLPIAMLSVLLFGMIKYSVQNNDLTVAERATNSETLQWEMRKVAKGEADSFGVPLFLAQNPNTPTNILEQLSKHDHSAVRIFVAQHPNTSLAVLQGMSNDCDPLIRQEVQARLKVTSASNSALQPTPNCGAAERKR